MSSIGLYQGLQDGKLAKGSPRGPWLGNTKDGRHRNVQTTKDFDTPGRCRWHLQEYCTANTWQPSPCKFPGCSNKKIYHASSALYRHLGTHHRLLGRERSKCDAAWTIPQLRCSIAADPKTRLRCDRKQGGSVQRSRRSVN